MLPSNFTITLFFIILCTASIHAQHPNSSTFSGPQSALFGNRSNNIANARPNEASAGDDELSFSGDINIRPEDIDSRAIVSPSLSGNYERVLWNHTKSKSKGGYNIFFQLQAPSSATEQTEYQNRLLTAGGVGKLSTEFYTEFKFTSHEALKLTISPSVLWQNSQVLTGASPNLNVPSFAYITTPIGLGVTLGPIFFSGIFNYNLLLTNSLDPTLSPLNKMGYFKGYFTLKLPNEFYLFGLFGRSGNINSNGGSFQIGLSKKANLSN